MNFKSIFSVLGLLVCFTGLAMLLGIPFSLYYGDTDIIPIILSSIISVISGLILWRIFRTDEKELGIKEGFLIAFLGWLAISLFGTLPYLLSDTIVNFTDAFFETVSGFTTTGASILTDVEKVPHGILFWRSTTHWIGGMGIIVLSLAIFPFLGIAGMQLFKAESSGPTKDKLTPRITETARLLWGVYILLTFSETLLLLLGGMSLFDALCHSFGTIATGGFSTKNSSIAFYNSTYIDFVVGIFMFLSAINFSLHYAALKGDVLNYFRNSEFKFYLLYVSIAITYVTVINFFTQNGYTLFDAFRVSFFNVISASSCTGFANSDFALWAPAAQFIIVLVMFIGGCAGSTTGAIKSVRVMILLRNTFKEAARILHPQAVVPIKFNKRIVDQDIISMISSFFMLYITTFFISSLLLIIDGVDLISAMSGVVACMGGVGPGLNTVGPMANYAHLPIFSKYVLCADMLLGRLELFTIMVIFTKSFWKV
ncbi:MAG: Potassium uptake protein TrkH [Ignavibacteriae bacterium]|nr:MAG: Potassium uptake protein TrkH [Ignavibacteriota bacterium]